MSSKVLDIARLQSSLAEIRNMTPRDQHEFRRLSAIDPADMEDDDVVLLQELGEDYL